MRQYWHQEARMHVLNTIGSHLKKKNPAWFRPKAKKKSGLTYRCAPKSFQQNPLPGMALVLTVPLYSSSSADLLFCLGRGSSANLFLLFIRWRKKKEINSNVAYILLKKGNQERIKKAK
jgi:hypothetical protein